MEPKFHLTPVAHPSMRGHLIYEPFSVVWTAHVVNGLGILLSEEPIVIGLVSSQQIDMEGRVNPSIFELLGQL